MSGWWSESNDPKEGPPTLAEIIILAIILGAILVGLLLWLGRVAEAGPVTPPIHPLPSRQYVAIGQLVGQQPWRPHDPEHRQPPSNWFCTNEPGHGEHTCDCQHSCEKEPPTNSICDEDGSNCTEVPNPNAGRERVVENNKCAVFCHPEHCACDTKNCHNTD